jgi:hypothetical protein
MAEDTIIDKAMALIPGVGGTKKKSSAAQRHKQLQAIQKKLAALASDVEKLAVHVADEAKNTVTGRKAPAKKPASKPAAKPAKAPARKTAAAKPAASTKKPAASPKKKPAAKKSTKPA